MADESRPRRPDADARAEPVQAGSAAPQPAPPEPARSAQPAPGPAADAAPDAAPLTEPDETATSGVDLGRRRFFRQFTSDLIQTVATVAGAATALQRTSAEAASAILDPAGAALRLEPSIPAVAVDPATGAPIAPAVFRTSFRVGDADLILIDQRRLPDAVIEYQCATAAEVAHAIRERVIRGHPAIAQAAALGLALAAERMRTSAPYARRAAIHGSGNALVNALPTSFTLRRAVDRMLAVFKPLELSEDADAVAVAMRAEAEAIVAEATAAHGRIADLALAELPTPLDHPLRIVTLGSSGVLAGGQFGTALGVVSAAASAGRDLHVYLCETRPLLEGARLAAWELGNLGVPYTLLADAAAPMRIARGEVDTVLVAADHVAANGDLAAVAGSYALAAVAARHGVPFVVCAPLSTVDLDTADGAHLRLEERAAADVLWVGRERVAPDGAHAANVVQDVVPGELISALVTEAGVLRAPYAPALAAILLSDVSRPGPDAAPPPEPARPEPAPAPNAAPPPEPVESSQPVESSAEREASAW